MKIQRMGMGSVGKVIPTCSFIVVDESNQNHDCSRACTLLYTGHELLVQVGLQLRPSPASGASTLWLLPRPPVARRAPIPGTPVGRRRGGGGGGAASGGVRLACPAAPAGD